MSRAPWFQRSAWHYLTLTAIFVAVNRPMLSGWRYVPYDSTDQNFPQVLFVVRSLLRNDAPWWNPLTYAGIPVLGDPQSMIFTPHVMAGLLAGSHFGQYIFDLTTLLCGLAGAGALMAYGERVGGGKSAPLLGAVLFMLGGVASSRLQHVNQIVSYCTIPVILLCVYLLCARPSLGRALLLAVAGALFVLNPNQVVYLAPLALAPLAALHVAHSPRPARAVLWGAVACGLAAASALPQISAIVETIGLSTRHGMTLEESAIASFPAFNVFSLVLPGLYNQLDAQGRPWAPTDLTQDYLYLGMVPAGALLLVLARLARAGAVSWLALAMIPVCFLYAMGTNTPFYPWLFAHFPGVSGFRRPADAAFLINMLAAVAIAGQRPVAPGERPSPIGLVAVVGAVMALVAATPGLVQFASSNGRLPALWHLSFIAAGRAAVSAVVVVALAFLASRLHRSGAAVAAGVFAIPIAGWTAFDLSIAGRLTRFTSPIDTFTEATSYRTPDAARTRGDSVASMLNTMAGTVPHELGPWRMEAIGGGMGASLPMLYGLANAQGYNAIKLETYAAVFGVQKLMDETKRFTPAAPGYDSVPYRWIGLRYVLLNAYIFDHADQFGLFGQVVGEVRRSLAAGPGAWLKQRDGGYEIWELTGAYPKAVLTEPDRLDWSAAPSPDGSCDVKSFRNTLVTVACVSTRPARLVLSEVMAPGWRACRDGAASPIALFGGVLRSTIVPAGQSTIEFIYEPVPFLRSIACRRDKD